MAFGSVIAGGMPIGLALFGLATGFSAVTIVAAFMDVAEVAPILASMIGLGVGIDYALFIITRHRQHLAEGMTVEEAAARANATAGQAVIFAGGTVVIAICGLALVGIPFIASMGYAAAIVVAVMVIASITLLPALLGFAGMKLASSSLPWAKAREAREARERAEGVRSHRRLAALGQPRRPPPVDLPRRLRRGARCSWPCRCCRCASARPTPAATRRDTTSRKAYDLVTEGFGPGMNGPLLLSVGPHRRRRGRRRRAARRSSTGCGPTTDVLFAPTRMVNAGGDAAVVTVIPKSAPAVGRDRRARPPHPQRHRPERRPASTPTSAG